MKLEGVRTMNRSMGLGEAGAQKLKRNDWSLKGYLSAFRAMLSWVLLMPGSGGRSMEAGLEAVSCLGERLSPNPVYKVPWGL